MDIGSRPPAAYIRVPATSQLGLHKHSDVALWYVTQRTGHAFKVMI